MKITVYLLAILLITPSAFALPNKLECTMRGEFAPTQYSRKVPVMKVTLEKVQSYKECVRDAVEYKVTYSEPAKVGVPSNQTLHGHNMCSTASQIDTRETMISKPYFDNTCGGYEGKFADEPLVLMEYSGYVGFIACYTCK